MVVKFKKNNIQETSSNDHGQWNYWGILYPSIWPTAGQYTGENTSIQCCFAMLLESDKPMDFFFKARPFWASSGLLGVWIDRNGPILRGVGRGPGGDLCATRRPAPPLNHMVINRHFDPRCLLGPVGARFRIFFFFVGLSGPEFGLVLGRRACKGTEGRVR